MTKKRRVSLPLKTSFRSFGHNVANVFLLYLKNIRRAAVRRPEYWATTVPAAIPAKPIPSYPRGFIPRARTMLMSTFIPLTVKSVAIGLTLSCIPMNHPLKAIRPRVAGAAHMRMKKYFEASERTSGVQSTTRKAALTNIHWMAIRAKAHARAIPKARVKIRAHSFLSPRPYA